VSARLPYAGLPTRQEVAPERALPIARADARCPRCELRWSSPAVPPMCPQHRRLTVPHGQQWLVRRAADLRSRCSIPADGRVGHAFHARELQGRDRPWRARPIRSLGPRSGNAERRRRPDGTAGATSGPHATGESRTTPGTSGRPTPQASSASRAASQVIRAPGFSLARRKSKPTANSHHPRRPCAGITSTVCRAALTAVFLCGLLFAKGTFWRGPIVEGSHHGGRTGQRRTP
jgi:hypothetical protein